MHLHLNRPAKRAGEEGKALRASGKVFIYFRSKIPCFAVLIRWGRNDIESLIKLMKIQGLA